jgi:hypothetical protein
MNAWTLDLPYLYDKRVMTLQQFESKALRVWQTQYYSTTVLQKGTSW